MRESQESEVGKERYGEICPHSQRFLIQWFEIFLPNSSIQPSSLEVNNNWSASKGKSSEQSSWKPVR